MNRSSIILLLVLVLGALAALFSVQNSARATQLSLDLGFVAWQLKDPVAVPVLIGVSLGVGLVLGLGVGFVWVVRLRRDVRELEQRLTLSQLASTSGPSKGKETGGW